LEHCIQAWRACREKDTDKKRNVLRRATKLIPELKYFGYKITSIRMWFEKTIN